MKKDLLSLNDENSILITVEFLMASRRYSYGEIETRRFELDLIVNQYITCHQLLEAVGKGLENRLWDMGIQPNSDKALVYHDKVLSSLHECIIAPAKDRLTPKILEKVRKMDETTQEYDEAVGNKDEPQSDPVEDYITCLTVYQECMRAYRSGYDGIISESDDIKKIEEKLMQVDKYQCHPVIGRGSIDVNTVGQESLLSISSRPQCWLIHTVHDEMTLKELGFMTTTRLVFDPILWHHSAPLFDEREGYPVITAAFSKETPKYNISDRPLKKLDDETVKVIEPTPPPEKQKNNLLTVLLPTLLSAVALFGVRMLMNSNSGTSNMMMMTAAMTVTSVVATVVNSILQKREQARSIKEWTQQYQSYIKRLLKKIVDRQTKDVELLHKFYPPAISDNEQGPSLVKKVQTVNGDIFSRGPTHPDFLTVRLGVSKEDSRLVPSVFQIDGSRKEAVFASYRYKNILSKEGIPFLILKENENHLGASDSTEGYLIDLPGDIATHYGYLRNAPVRVNLKECGALGIVYGKQKNDCLPYLSNILLDLCFHHSPEDLQLVMFCEKTDDWIQQQSVIRRFKHLPHFHGALGDMSAFVFQDLDAHRVFDKLSEILAERKDAGEDARFPHIVVLFQEEYSLKRHLFSQALPEYGEKGVIKKDGISFIFCSQYTEQLPKFCGNVVYFENENEHLLLPHNLLIPSVEKSQYSLQKDVPLDEMLDVPFRREHYSYRPDPLAKEVSLICEQEKDDEYVRAFKILSALRYERIAQGADMPSNYSLFDMFRELRKEEMADSEARKESANTQADNFLQPVIKAPIVKTEEQETQKNEQENPRNEQECLKEKIIEDLEKYVKHEWGLDNPKGNTAGNPKRDVTSTLTVPIGKNTQGIVSLDLHEKGDGPHMLVAGTTGSGKTETILTYLVNLCALYTPEQVTLLLMDMKGEDFVARIGKLPHVVGTVSDVDGDKTGTNTAYMLKRFLISMNAEVQNRKVLLSKMGVNNISAYIEAKRDLDKHMRNHRIAESRRKELENLEPMPHLFLVIDEFTELMQFTEENSGLDFKSAITSLARVGRSLGFHIILISQNIENAITPDIRVNSRARLCLKVATRDASKEMIGTDLAASPLMPGNGRAYLLVGTGSRFDYFQSAYSGADIMGDTDQSVVITHAAASGKYQLYYNSELQKIIDQERSPLAGDEEKADPGKETLPAEKKTQKESTSPKIGIKQIEMLRDVIIDQVWKTLPKGVIEPPHKVFQEPLPSKCWYNFDWIKGEDEYENLTKKTKDQETQ